MGQLFQLSQPPFLQNGDDSSTYPAGLLGDEMR